MDNKNIIVSFGTTGTETRAAPWAARVSGNAMPLADGVYFLFRFFFPASISP